MMLLQHAKQMPASALCGRLRLGLPPQSLLSRIWLIPTSRYLLTPLHLRLHPLRYRMLLSTRGIYIRTYRLQIHLLMFLSIFLPSLLLQCLLPFHLLHLFRQPPRLQSTLLQSLHLQPLHAVVAPCAHRLALVRPPTRQFTPTRPPTLLTSTLLRLASCNLPMLPIQNLIRWL